MIHFATRSWAGNLGQYLGLVGSIAVCVVASLSAPAVAQCTNCLQQQYEPSLGLPASQCWSPNNPGGGSGSAFLDGPVLVNTSTNSIRAFVTQRPAFDWSLGCTLEARVSVPHGNVRLPASGGNGLRAAYFGGPDSAGRLVLVWLWANGVALSTDANANQGSGLAMLSFDAASAPHVYTVLTDANGAALNIDGVQRLSLRYHNTTTDTSYRNDIEFGNDSRVQGYMETHWSYVHFSAIRQPTDVAICPLGTATLSVSPVGNGLNPYIWRKGGAALGDIVGHRTGTHSPTLTIIGATAADVGSYDCLVASACGSVTSDPATLTICGADFNCDGTVDFFDYDDFVVCFEGGACPPGKTADFDGDGAADFFDYDAFVRAFETPC